MNALNGSMTSIFDVLLSPLELLGPELTLILVSAIFGVGALVIFKHISWQRGIKAAKDKIKGHMIEIRLYQDNLLLVGKAILKVLYRNFQYVALNFGPFIPLSIPFVLVAAQLVVRYSFAPLPVVEEQATADMLPGEGTMIEVRMRKGREADVRGLRLELPPGLRAMSPLVRVPSEGRAFQEVVARSAGDWQIVAHLADGTKAQKRILTGDAEARSMQPERVGGFFDAWLWPAEETLGSDSPVERIAFAYPDRDLAWLPEGPGGVLVTFVLAAMVFGFAALKPLGVQI